MAERGQNVLFFKHWQGKIVWYQMAWDGVQRGSPRS